MDLNKDQTRNPTCDQTKDQTKDPTCDPGQDLLCDIELLKYERRLIEIALYDDKYYLLQVLHSYTKNKYEGGSSRNIKRVAEFINLESYALLTLDENEQRNSQSVFDETNHSNTLEQAMNPVIFYQRMILRQKQAKTVQISPRIDDTEIQYVNEFQEENIKLNIDKSLLTFESNDVFAFTEISCSHKVCELVSYIAQSECDLGIKCMVLNDPYITMGGNDAHIIGHNRQKKEFEYTFMVIIRTIYSCSQVRIAATPYCNLLFKDKSMRPQCVELGKANEILTIQTFLCVVQDSGNDLVKRNILDLLNSYFELNETLQSKLELHQILLWAHGLLPVMLLREVAGNRRIYPWFLNTFKDIDSSTNTHNNDIPLSISSTYDSDDNTDDDIQTNNISSLAEFAETDISSLFKPHTISSNNRGYNMNNITRGHNGHSGSTHSYSLSSQIHGVNSSDCAGSELFGNLFDNNGTEPSSVYPIITLCLNQDDNIDIVLVLSTFPDTKYLEFAAFEINPERISINLIEKLGNVKPNGNEYFVMVIREEITGYRWMKAVPQSGEYQDPISDPIKDPIRVSTSVTITEDYLLYVSSTALPILLHLSQTLPGSDDNSLIIQYLRRILIEYERELYQRKYECTQVNYNLDIILNSNKMECMDFNDKVYNPSDHKRLPSLCIVLNEEYVGVREIAFKLLDMLVTYNPVHIMPSIRKNVLEVLTYEDKKLAALLQLVGNINYELVCNGFLQYRKCIECIDSLHIYNYDENVLKHIGRYIYTELPPRVSPSILVNVASNTANHDKLFEVNAICNLLIMCDYSDHRVKSSATRALTNFASNSKRHQGLLDEGCLEIMIRILCENNELHKVLGCVEIIQPLFHLTVMHATDSVITETIRCSVLSLANLANSGQSHPHSLLKIEIQMSSLISLARFELQRYFGLLLSNLVENDNDYDLLATPITLIKLFSEEPKMDHLKASIKDAVNLNINIINYDMKGNIIFITCLSASDNSLFNSGNIKTKLLSYLNNTSSMPLNSTSLYYVVLQTKYKCLVRNVKYYGGDTSSDGAGYIKASKPSIEISKIRYDEGTWYIYNKTSIEKVNEAFIESYGNKLLIDTSILQTEALNNRISEINIILFEIKEN